MLPQDTEIGGVRVPRFLYGTAWKEEETQRLTELALQQGFRDIDTANQRRHYHEAAVGHAIATMIRSGPVAPRGRQGDGARGRKILGSPLRPLSPSPPRSLLGEGEEGAKQGLSGLTRDDLFLQTKFTSRQGQDHRLPYDPDAPVPIQVEQSFAGSEQARPD